MARSSRFMEMYSALAGVYQSGGTTSRTTEAFDASLFRSFIFCFGFSGLGSGQSANVTIEGSADQTNWAVIKTQLVLVGSDPVPVIVAEPVTKWVRVKIEYYDGTFTVAFANGELKD